MQTLYCSFCRKPSTAVAKLVGGPGVYICDACVGLCVDILEGRSTPGFPGFASLTEAQLLSTLQPSSAAVESTRALLQQHVDMLRGRGVSWDKIGRALGVTRQAAWERFG